MKTVGPIAPAQKLQRSSSSQRRANPRDLTGTRKQQLEAQVAQERALREAEMAAAVQEAAQEREDVVIDYSQGGTSSPGVQPGGEVAPAVEEVVEVEAPVVAIRVNAPIEDMVFGRKIEHPGDAEAGIAPVVGPLQFYNFEEGRTYHVPAPLARHLERIGYLYH